MIATTAQYMSDYEFNGVDYLVKTPNSIELPNIEDIITYSTYPRGKNSLFTKVENPFDMVQIRYVAKANGTYWSSEEEMDDAQINDLVYYNSKKEAEQDGAEILGMFFQARDGKEIVDRYRLLYVIPVKIRDNAELNYVYPVYHESVSYTINTAGSENGITFDHGVEHLNEQDIMNQRVKCLYDSLYNTYGGFNALAGVGKKHAECGMM